MCVLIVSPHPDDAEIGCGGMIHQLRSKGQRVAIAICSGEGDLRMQHSGHSVSYVERQAEQTRAALCLGAPDLLWLNLGKAAEFDQVPQVEFVKAFDSLFGDFDEIYLPLPSYNADHRRVWEAGLAAFRPGKLSQQSLCAYEQPFGTEAPQFGRRYIPLTGEDMEAKKKAILAHTSQVEGRENTLVGVAGASAQAWKRGLEVYVGWAELVFDVRRIG